MNSEYRQAVDKYGQKVYAFACYSLRGRQDADDITQEVLVKLWQNWSKVDPERILAWLMRVTRTPWLTTSASGNWRTPGLTTASSR